MTGANYKPNTIRVHISDDYVEGEPPLAYISADGDLSITSAKTYVELSIFSDPVLIDFFKDKSIALGVRIENPNANTWQTISFPFNQYSGGLFTTVIEAWKELLDGTTGYKYTFQLIVYGFDDASYIDIVGHSTINLNKIFAESITLKDKEIDLLREQLNQLDKRLKAIEDVNAGKITPVQVDPNSSGNPYHLFIIGEPRTGDVPRWRNGTLVWSGLDGAYVKSVNGVKPVQSELHIEAKDISFNGDDNRRIDTEIYKLMSAFNEHITADKRNIQQLSDMLNNINNRLYEVENTLVDFKNNQ